MTAVAFFNNKGGVGKTTLVYHLGWAFADRGKRVLMVDLDPQSNLTAMCLDEERLEQIWVDDDMRRLSIRGAVQPIIDGIGDIQPAHIEELSTRLSLIPGDIRLSAFEQKLSDAWPRCMDRDPAAFRVASSFHRIIVAASLAHKADVVLIDVGPDLGAVNRSALISAGYVATPLGADLFSLQGLRNLGPTLQRWREEWAERLVKSPAQAISLPDATIAPIGYIVMQPNLYGGQVTRSYERWLREIPTVYARSVLGQAVGDQGALTVGSDPCCLAVLRHYRSLMTMAQTARKPIFHLTAADGAIASHAQAARQVGVEIRSLADRIAARLAEAGAALV